MHSNIFTVFLYIFKCYKPKHQLQKPYDILHTLIESQVPYAKGKKKKAHWFVCLELWDKTISGEPMWYVSCNEKH